MLQAAHDLASLLTVVIGYCDSAITANDIALVRKARAAAAAAVSSLNAGIKRTISGVPKDAHRTASLICSDYVERIVSAAGGCIEIERKNGELLLKISLPDGGTVGA